MTVAGCETLDEFFDGEARGDVAAAFRKHLADCDRCAQKLLGRMLEEIAVGQIAQRRELRAVMREVGADLAENFVGADAEERYGLQEHGKRLLRASGNEAPAQPPDRAP